MINYLVELIFLIFGFYLLKQSQYLTCLILLILSLILLIKGFKYKESIIITIIFIIFLTQYHIYFPLKQTENEIENYNNSLEGFKNNEKNKVKHARNIKKEKLEKELLLKERKEKKKKKKQEKILDMEEEKSYSNFPKKYRQNVKKINKPSINWGEGLSKWNLLKENLFIILNS